MMPAPDLAHTARWYARRGIAVLPLAPRGKTPITTHGVHDASADARDIATHWAREPQAHVGLACGSTSGVVVLDIDGPDGEAALAALVQAHGELPITPEVHTGRGRHLYFAATREISNSASKLGTGIDVRGNGGYVVAPPSVHPSGAVYRWADGRGLHQVPLAPMPEWLIHALTARPARNVQLTPAPIVICGDTTPYGRAAIERECADMASAPEGTRNARVNAAAFAAGQLVAGGELAEHDARDALRLAAATCGLPEREARKTIESGFTSGMREPRRAPERVMAADGARRSANDADAPWDEPIPLPGLPPVPRWNDALLPDAIRPWVPDIASRLQCPSEYVAVAAIVTLASVIGRGCALRPKQHDTWTVVPNLWGAIVGPPSAMKSPALREAMRPLHDLATTASAEHASAQFDRDEIEARKGALRKALQRAAEGGDDNVAELRERHEQLVEQARVANAERRFVVNDPSVEKLGEILSANPRGVLLYRDELTGWLKTLERAGHEGDRAFFLEAWNGTGSYVCDRIGRGTTRIEAACVSILGGIQPGPLAAYLREAVSGGGGADGLMQRFQLTVYPDPPATWRSIDRVPDASARERACELYGRMADLTASDVGAEVDDDGVPFLRFSPDGQVFFGEWHASLMTRARSGEDHEAMEGHLVKYQSLMPSLALVFHLADAGCGPVSLTSAQRAAAWCELLEAHARRVYASANTGEHSGARSLLGKLRAGKLTSPFAGRDVYRQAWSGLTSPEAAERAIDALEAHGWVRRVTVATSGRPRVEVHVHPSLRGSR